MVSNSPVLFARSRIRRTGGPLTQAVLTICALFVFSGYSYAQEWKTVHDGVEYAHVEHKIGDTPVKINLLRLDLRKVRLDVHHALDKAIGLETTSSIAKRKGAVAAINSGFFRLDKSEWAGDASEILMIDRQMLSEPVNIRIGLYICNTKESTSVFFGHPDWNSFLWFDQKDLKKDGAIFRFRINSERRSDDLVLYTPEFGQTTLTGNDGVEVIVRRERIVSISTNKGNSSIPVDGFVISASGSRMVELLNRSKSKHRVGPVYEVYYPHVEDLDDITNGVPQLIKNGKIDITWEQEKTTKSFVETRHPRTAVAKLKDGKFLMITVDGRSESSGGMSLYELADYILSLGATDAMNLDGGGSTTMYLDGKVVNHPSDKEGERKVSDAILVTLRRPRQKHDR